MTKLHYSNRTEALLERLAEDVAAHREAVGPWEPVVIVVPNRNVQLWLQQGLADALGIAANLRFCFLDRLWRDSIPAQAPPLRLLDHDTLRGQLLALFEDGALMAETGFGPYLAEDPGGRKAAQLSGRLARLFEEYLLSRPEWMLRWAQGQALTEDPREAPQRRLWQALRARLNGASEPWISLPEYFQSALFAKGRFPERIFAFGLSQMARVYHEGFRRLGELRPLDLYVLNPCEEFWEDVPNPRAAQPGAPDNADEDPFGLLLGEHLGLQRWGRPGRENLRLLNDLVDCDFEDHFREPSNQHLLGRLQAGLLHREPTLPEVPPLPIDDSLRVLACGSLRREAEAVASGIWERVQHGLRFSEVAVIVPPSQKAEYMDHLRAAFEACHRIPWVAGDEGSRRQAELLEAAELLLRLPASAFTRADLLRLLDHPGLAPGLEGLDAAALCEELGILRGFREGDDDDLWTWDMGLRRLALGALMPPGTLDLVGFSDPVTPPVGAGLFLARLRGLFFEARRLREQRQGPAAWGRALAKYLGGQLGDPEGGGDARLVARIQRAMGSLEALEAPGLPPPQLPFPAALELALEALVGLSRDAAVLGHGVVVSSYAPMRAVPFQAIFLMGLGEGVFPGQDVRNPLDLRSAKRQAGDVSRAEQDRYLFLESLLSARRFLTLSFVRRDARDGAPLEPSPLLRDLGELVGALVGPAGWQALRRDLPLNRFAAEAFDGAPSPECLSPEFSSGAWREAQAAELGRQMRQAAQQNDLGLNLADLGLQEPVRKALETRLRQVPPFLQDKAPEVLRLSFAQLKRWLECPLQGGAALLLGLRAEDEDDAAEREEELLQTAFLDRFGWLREAFWSACGGMDPVQALLEGRRRLMGLARTPRGIFAEAEGATALACLEGWRALAPGLHPRVARFGGEGPAGLPSEDHGALRWGLDSDGGPLRLELEGAAPPMADDAFILLSERAAPKPGKQPAAGDARDLLRPWIGHLALRAMDLPSPGLVRVLSFHQGLAQAWERHLPEWTPEAAKERLSAWCLDLVAGDPGPLPIEALLEGTEDLEDWISRRLESRRPDMASLRGPVPCAAELAPAPDWQNRAQRRLGDFLAFVAGDVESGLGPTTTWGCTRGDAERPKGAGGPPSFMAGTP